MDIEKSVIGQAATVYNVDAERITLDTVIREELSNKSIQLIAFVSSLEEEFGVTIEFHEAGALKTISDFVNKIKGMI